MSETVRPAQARRLQAAVGSRTAPVIAVQPIERFDMDLSEHSTHPTDGPRALSQEQLRRSAELVCTEGAGPEASAEQQVLSRAHAAMGRSIATLVQTNDLPSFLREMLLAAMSAVGAVTGAVARFDGLTAHHLVLRARDAWIPSEVLIAAGLHAVTLDDPVAQDFLRLLPTSEAHWVTASDNGWMPAPYRSFHKDQGTPTLCLVPLLIERRLVGWIGLGFDDHRPPTDSVDGARAALFTRVELQRYRRRAIRSWSRS